MAPYQTNLEFIDTPEPIIPPKVLKLIEFDSDGAPKLNEANLVEMRNKSGECPIQMIGVVGVQRTGKSFLLDTMRKGLEDFRIFEDPETEIGDKHSFGFLYRRGSEKCTNGIDVWSEPFFFRGKDQRQWALWLVDTQGFFDDEAPPRIAHFISSFVTMACDIVIFNAKQLDKQRITHFVDSLLLCQKCENAPSQNIKARLHIYDRDSLGDKFGLLPERFEKECWGEPMQIVRRAFEKYQHIAFPEPPSSIKTAVFDQPFKLGKRGEIQPKMRAFLDNMQNAFQLILEDCYDLSGRTQRCDFEMIKIICEKADEITKDQVSNQTKIWQDKCKTIQKDKYGEFVLRVDAVKFNEANRSLPEQLEAIQQICVQTRDSLSQELSRHPEEFRQVQIRKFEDRSRAYKLDAIFKIKQHHFQRYLNEQKSAYAERMRGAAGGSRAVIEQLHNHLSANLYNDRAQKRHEIFPDEAMIDRQNELIQQDLANQENFILETFEHLIGNVTLQNIRIETVDACEAIKRNVRENLKYIAENYWNKSYYHWQLRCRLRDSPQRVRELEKTMSDPYDSQFLQHLLNAELTKIRADFTKAKNEILTKNPDPRTDIVQNIIKENYSEHLIKHVQEAMTEAKTAINGKLVEKLSEKAKESKPFKDYLIELLKDPSQR